MILGWHSWFCSTLVLTASAFPGFCQDAGNRQFPAPTPSQRQQPDALSGQVIDSVTGQPISRALVQSGLRAVLTDHDGRFAFEHASSAFARKPGYFDNPPVPQPDGSVVLKLTPEAILYGTVTDANSQPVPRLRVQLRRLETRDGLTAWQNTNVTVTNAEGEFRFAELPAGRYSLTTGFLVDGLGDANSSIGFVPLLYPPPGTGESGTAPSQAALTLAAGEHLQANMNPAEEKLYPVSGTIRGASNNGANFEITTLDNLPIDTPIRFFMDGGFRLRLPLGSYRVTARTAVKDAQFFGTQEIAVGAAGLEGVTIELAALASIPVQLDYERTSNRKPQPEEPAFFNVMLANQDPGTRANIIPAQPREHPVGPWTPHPGDPLILRDLTPGRYVLETNTPAPWYVASAMCGNLDLTRDPLVVGESSGSCSLRLVLRDDSASVRWTAHGKGELHIWAYPLGNNVQNVVENLAGQNEASIPGGATATGTMEGLAPGRYLMIATTERQELPYRDSVAMEKYLALGKEITLAPNEENEVDLSPAPSGNQASDAGAP